MRQTDSYFRVALGRLKLRTIEGADGATAVELIAYRRPDEPGSRWSDYRRVTLDPASARGVAEALAVVCGVVAVVDKQREVAILGRTRIHLDRVTGLGSFIELETVADPSDDDDDAGLLREHEDVIRVLELGDREPVATSYGDLVERWADESDRIARKEPGE